MQNYITANLDWKKSEGLSWSHSWAVGPWVGCLNSLCLNGKDGYNSFIQQIFNKLPLCANSTVFTNLTDKENYMKALMKMLCKL